MVHIYFLESKYYILGSTNHFYASVRYPLGNHISSFALAYSLPRLSGSVSNLTAYIHELVINALALDKHTSINY